MSTAGCFAVALAALLLVLGAGPARATSGGCFFPSVVPEFFEDDFFDATELSLDTEICEDQCKDLHTGCRAAVKESHKCFVAFIEAIASGEKKSCEDIEDSEARKACKQGVKEDREAALGDLEEQKESGRDLCDEIFDDCLDNCLSLPS